MHAKFVTLWLQVVHPLPNVHETKWTPHVKRESDVAQSYISSGPNYDLFTLSTLRVEKLELHKKTSFYFELMGKALPCSNRVVHQASVPFR